MAFDDVIPGPQGSIKSSEIFTDRILPIIKNSVGETNLKVLEGMMKPISDALRYNNFLLFSDGQIVWETNLGQPRIRFNHDAKANNIRLRLMMLDEQALSRTVDIVIPATLGANGLNGFNTINMNNNDLIYMELSRDVILNAISGTPASTPAVITLENGIDGGSVTSGRRLLKVNMTGNTGMPAMVADLDSILQDNSQTVNIPIASRYDWTDGIDTYSDIWWIPHGIRWPTGSISVIGAVVVSGFDALPNYFSRTIIEFNQHLTLLATTGGTIAIIRPITINSPITIPAGVNIVGRTTKNDNTSPGLYFSSGGKLIMGARSSVKGLYIRGLAGFGQGVNEHIIEIAGAGVNIAENFFEFVSGTSTLARGINLLNGAQDFRIERNTFTSVSALTTALYYSAASYIRANQSANQFTTILEATYATRAAALNMNNSYGIVPIGTILPWMGAAFTNAANASPVSLAASYATLATMLPEGWVICDGRALPTDSPLRTGGNTFTPNMTTRFVLGANALGGGLGGTSGTISLSTTQLPTHAHTMTHGHGIGTLGISGGPYATQNHTHNFDHAHQWGYTTTNALYVSRSLTTVRSTLSTIADFSTTAPGSLYLAEVRRDPNTNGHASAITGASGYLYTSAPLAPPTVQPGGGAGQRSSYTGGVAALNGTAANTGTNGGIASGALSGSVANMTGNTSDAGSGGSFSVMPPYINAVYIMRYK